MDAPSPTCEFLTEDPVPTECGAPAVTFIVVKLPGRSVAPFSACSEHPEDLRRGLENAGLALVGGGRLDD